MADLDAGIVWLRVSGFHLTSEPHLLALAVINTTSSLQHPEGCGLLWDSSRRQGMLISQKPLQLSLGVSLVQIGWWTNHHIQRNRRADGLKPIARNANEAKPTQITTLRLGEGHCLKGKLGCFWRKRLRWTVAGNRCSKSTYKCPP